MIHGDLAHDNASQKGKEQEVSLFIVDAVVQ